MAIGFVLISAETGKDRDVYNQLLKVGEITDLMPLFGEFDLIAKIEATTFDDLGKIVVERIRSVPGVTKTKTLTGTSSERASRTTHGVH